jgi:hypothetical protein
MAMAQQLEHTAGNLEVTGLHWDGLVHDEKLEISMQAVTVPHHIELRKTKATSVTLAGGSTS